MNETTEIKTTYNEGTITAEISFTLRADLPSAERFHHRVPLIGVSHVYDDPDDMERPEENGLVDFWLVPDNAVKLAHRLLTLAYQTGTEIGE